MTYSTPYNSWSWRLGWMESHSNSGRGLEFEGLFQPFFIGRKEISPHSCSDLELVGNRFRVTVQCRRGEVLEWCLLVKPWCQQVGYFHAKKRSLYSFVCLRHPWHLQGHFVSLEFWGSNSSNSQDYSEEWILKNFYHLATLPILDWDWRKGMTTRNTQSCASKKQDSWKKPTLFPGKIHSLRHSIMHLLVTDPWNHGLFSY